MRYDEALKRWGASKLRPYTDSHCEIDWTTVRVELEFDGGNPCCGGRDPECYCSFATSPSADVEITGLDDAGRKHQTQISHYSFDFATMIKELAEIADGQVLPS